MLGSGLLFDKVEVGHVFLGHCLFRLGVVQGDFRIDLLDFFLGSLQLQLLHFLSHGIRLRLVGTKLMGQTRHSLEFSDICHHHHRNAGVDIWTNGLQHKGHVLGLGIVDFGRGDIHLEIEVPSQILTVDRDEFVLGFDGFSSAFDRRT